MISSILFCINIKSWALCSQVYFSKAWPKQLILAKIVTMVKIAFTLFLIHLVVFLPI